MGGAEARKDKRVWTLGHGVVLAGCVFLIGKVWASLKATWKE